MRVCAILDIPFITLDLEKEYKKEVVDYMISEYKEGRTPNPDVMCNKEIKFGHFLRFALKNSADFVATGHYACAIASHQTRGGRDACPPVAFGREVRVRLKEGADKNKDQSYFLWTLTQEQLKHVLFPIGHLQKPEVRKLAGKFGLPQETRKDSQGVCFLGQINMKEFLKEYVGAKKGDVINEKGEKIGEHDGATLYTIGERHGFNVTQKSENGAPLYVISKNILENTITVASKTAFQKVLGSPLQSSTRLFSKQFSAQLKDVNLIGNMPNKNLLCRIRYRQEKISCKLERNKEKIRIIFDKPQMGVSPGQSLVLYDGEICLGGGIIN
jgi:tRNA-uridine 2-sulfurtransferase